MKDNYIIGILLGIIVSRLDFWQYTNEAAPIVVFMLVAFIASWGKRILEDDIKHWKEISNDI